MFVVRVPRAELRRKPSLQLRLPHVLRLQPAIHRGNHRLLRALRDAPHVDEMARETALFSVRMHDAQRIADLRTESIEIRCIPAEFAGGFIDSAVGVIGAIRIRSVVIGTVHRHMVHNHQFQSGLLQNRQKPAGIGGIAHDDSGGDGDVENGEDPALSRGEEVDEVVFFEESDVGGSPDSRVKLNLSAEEKLAEARLGGGIGVMPPELEGGEID